MFDVTQFMTDRTDLPVATFEWGAIQWLCNEELSPGAKQTLGITHILPGRTNPRHFHPNCEEVLYLLSGCGRHSFGDDFIELQPGMTIRIPAGVTHNLTNTGSELLTCLIAFNSGHRETVFLE
ncbi:MAG: cupin domain-containing protein [Planctomycetales bacterium]|nr:cupin domain-containing protein [Planctomycetales bacterium]